MKNLKNWSRFMPIKEKTMQQLAVAKTDSRLLSIARRILVLEKAIQKMNKANGMFLDKKDKTTPYTLDQMKAFREKMISKLVGVK